MEHTRAGILRLIPQAGDKLLTNKRRPILTVMEDTCGVHDLLIAACDIYRYQVCISGLYQELMQVQGAQERIRALDTCKRVLSLASLHCV